MTRLRTLAALLGLLVPLVGCGDLDGPQRTTRISGALLVLDRAGIGAAQQGAKGFFCYGDRAYADLRPGTAVVVQDSSGHGVAAGTLGGGRMMVDLETMESGGSPAGVTQGCQLGIAVQGVPPIGVDWSLRVGARQFPLDPSHATNLRITVG